MASLLLRLWREGFCKSFPLGRRSGIYAVHPFLDSDVDAEQGRLQGYFVWLDSTNAEHLRSDIFANPVGEELVWRLVLEGSAGITVDVGHEQLHVRLRQVVERRGLGVVRCLWQDISYEFVVAFDERLLPGAVRVAVKQFCELQ